MNPLQHIHQMRYLLAGDTWPSGSQKRVYGNVEITDGPSEKAVKEFTPPFVLLGVGDVEEVDEDDPELFVQQFGIVLVQTVLGDPTGSRILTGGARKDAGVSDGAGLLQLEERLISSVGMVTGADGCRNVIAFQGAPPSERIRDTLYGSRKYLVKAWCTRRPHYDPPRNLVASAVAGAVTLSWTLPPDRYDRRQIVLRRAPGATAPSSATSGTGVTLSGNLATGVVDNPGTGQFSYAVFCGYDHSGSGMNEAYSEQELGTKRTVSS